MNRRHSRDDYLGIARALRSARPDIAQTTDLIVAFPGETREDFEQTLSLMREVEFVDSFSFKYSPRPGTPAERRGLEPLDPVLAQERLAELQALQRQLTLAAHRSRVGQTTQVLVEGTSRHGGSQLTGRCPQNRVINFTARSRVEPGSLHPVHITEAQPHSLLGVSRDGPDAQELQHV
jgi:tRNA-2-methylthio-N6-dimethylallyladenosine synthase